MAVAIRSSPSIAARAGARTVEVELADGARSTRRRCWRRSTPRTRVVVLCNPNDPTGGYMPSPRASASCSRGCPSTSTCSSTRPTSSSRTSRTRTPACGSSRRSRACSCSAPSRRPTGSRACGPATWSARRPRRTCSRARADAGRQRAHAGHRAAGAARSATATSRGGARLVIEQRAPAVRGTRCAAGRGDRRARRTSSGYAAPGLSGDELARRLEQSRVRVAPGGRSATSATCAPRSATSTRPTACSGALREALGERRPVTGGRRFEAAAL